MDFDIYLKPSNWNYAKTKPNSLGEIIQMHTEVAGIPDLENIDIALIGVEEDRGTINNEGCSMAPNKIREQLFDLYPTFKKAPSMVDLGNIKRGESVDDTYFAVSEVTKNLLKRNIIPIILGGTQDLTYASYMAYEKLEQIINLVSIDKKIDFNTSDLLPEDKNQVLSDNFLSKILLHQPSYLFNYSNIGYQSYFESSFNLDLLTKLHFDTYRLGEINGPNIQETEPILRNADIVSIDISAVKFAEAPGNANASPHGFYGEELCQLCRYAGLSDKVSTIGFYEYNPTLDPQNNQTAQLIAQAIWYFMDGFYNRKNEYPLMNTDQFLKFRVVVEEENHEIIFYKSTSSDRWWMEVPYPVTKTKFNRHHVVPCSYTDYKKACDDGIPERWWKTFQKLL